MFGRNGDEPLDAAIVRAKFAALAADVGARTGHPRTPEEVADGFLKIAVANMANAIKHISVERGYDVTEYTLCCFGGAGGQHACQVADALGMTRVLLHPFAGVLSAYGMGLADVRALRQQAVEARLTAATLADAQPVAAALEAKARDDVAAQGIGRERIAATRTLHLKYEGTDTTLETAVGEIPAIVAEFERKYRQQYGFLMPDKPLVVEAIAVEAVGKAHAATDAPLSFSPRAGPLVSMRTTRIYTDGALRDAAVYDRDALRPGDAIPGPAVIREDNATTIVEPGWRASFTVRGDVVLDRVEALRRTHAIGTSADPVLLEVFNNLFMAIAEQMGVTLANTAYSVNIKERLDFSCALFDGDGNLIANAPHMPVHLGSMGESVKTIIERRWETMRPGDVYVLNAPYNGGTHLPDVTVIAPVFLAPSTAFGVDVDALFGQGLHPRSRGGAAQRAEFYVASRGHHADIGGITPGSMPSGSTHVDEEGVLLDNVELVAQGRFLEAEIRAILGGGRYPVAQRRPEHRRSARTGRRVRERRTRAFENGRAFRPAGGARLHAARAGQRRGGGAPRARRADRRAFRVRDGQRRDDRRDHRDRQGGRARRRSTSPGRVAQQPTNFNAPSAVCKAAVLYVFRTLVDDEIPMNAGCLKPLADRDSRRARCSRRAIRPRSWPATSRRRRRSPTRCTARSACWRPRRAR